MRDMTMRQMMRILVPTPLPIANIMVLLSPILLLCSCINTFVEGRAAEAARCVVQYSVPMPMVGLSGTRCRCQWLLSLTLETDRMPMAALFSVGDGSDRRDILFAHRIQNSMTLATATAGGNRSRQPANKLLPRPI